MKKDNRPKLCITSPWNYPLFNPDNKTHFGGWEVRIALIAKELACRGNFQVNLIVGDHGQPHLECRHGVNLYSWQARQIWGIPFPSQKDNESSGYLAGIIDRLRGKRFRKNGVSGTVGTYTITPEMTAIYDEVDADIYMVPGNSQFSGEVAFYARQREKKYVFLAGSDMDYYPEYRLHPDQLDIYSVPFALKTYAIENADAHIVQNERQLEMLQTGYERSGTVIKNPIDLALLYPRNDAADTILWVGKSDERVKRPSLVLELARQLPEYKFIVVMNVGLPETHAIRLEEARSLPNVVLIERVPFEQIESQFANARLHLNTSVFEGFPNTFLQAAKYGVPTISLVVDPGSMLSTHGCGFTCGGDLEKMKGYIRDVMSDNDLFSDLGRHALHYVEEYHDKEKIIQKYEQVLGR
ncbi:MAG: glycosyltransferase [Anaerolineales bacterium]|nr:glycosyltransferase [Anaerolineales bacterium]